MTTPLAHQCFWYSTPVVSSVRSILNSLHGNDFENSDHAQAGAEQANLPLGLSLYLNLLRTLPLQLILSIARHVAASVRSLPQGIAYYCHSGCA